MRSDRGARCRWPGWVALCEAHGLARSMSRKGTSPDNARAEGFFGLVKNEFFRCREWSGVTVEEFMAELDSWLGWFCAGRCRRTLGWLTPDGRRVSQGYALA